MSHKLFNYFEAFEKAFLLYLDNIRVLLPLALLAVAVPALLISCSLVLLPLAMGFGFMVFVIMVASGGVLLEGRMIVWGNLLGAAALKATLLIAEGAAFFLLVSLGLLFLLWPGLFMAIQFGFFLHAQIFEDKGFAGSFQRSRELVGAHFWPTAKVYAGSFIFLGVIILPIWAGMALLFSPFWLQLTVITLTLGILLPVVVLIQHQLYVHLRQQHDGQFKIHETLVTGR